MRKFTIAFLAAFAVLIFSHQLSATTTSTTAKIGVDQGSARSYVASGGHMDVESGGYIDVQSGGNLKIAGTSLTPTAAEFNTLAGITATSTQLNSVVNGSFCITGSCSETTTTNAGAISVATFQTLISSAGAESRTLAAPGQNGLMKLIQMTVHGGNVTLAGTNIWGNTAKTCTFVAVGDTLFLVSSGGKWIIIGQNGAACA